MSTMRDVLVAHRWKSVDGLPGCTCGVVLDEYQDQATHAFDKQKEWLAANGFTTPMPSAHAWTTCAICGCVVGLPDEHREVCH